MFGGVRMIPRIKSVKPLDKFMLYVVFDDGKVVYYDVKEDISAIEDFKDLESIKGLFKNVQLDESRTCIYWSDRIDLPSDTVYEFGKVISGVKSESDEIKAILEGRKDRVENGTVSHDEIDWD